MDRINENKEYARVRTNKDCTRLISLCIYDLINERYCDAYIEPFRTHSETHVFSVMLNVKTDVIADRGYESYLLMAQIQHDRNISIPRGSMIKGYPFQEMVLLIKQLPIFIRKHKTKGQKLIQSFTKGSPQDFINKEQFYVKMTLLLIVRMDRKNV